MSDLFNGDAFAALGDDKLVRAFQMISEICSSSDYENPSLRGAAFAINPDLQFVLSGLSTRIYYAISLDNERKIRKLKSDIAKLKHENTQLVNENVELSRENTKLKNDNSTSSEMIRKAREKNNELLDLYNLSDEAANLPDAEILLEHLNTSLTNFPYQEIENLSFKELRKKYASLRRNHRQALSSFKVFKQRLHESREIIKVLEVKKNKLIDEKDEIALKDAKALEKFQETLIEAKLERDSILKVLNDARNNLGVNVSLQTEHSELLADIISNYEVKKKEYEKKVNDLEIRLAAIEKELSTRNFKYQQMKENWFNLVQNNSNGANRSREASVKRVCAENGIPLSKYNFPAILENVPIPDIQVTDGEEDSEEETNESEAERDEDEANE
ncbi:uncharacterized protein LOC113335915 [Papaver somniferum]|uniref:uncharacterized protein LOC113335915 n=1 Tax=Papaver somniferum TaxID=3469 RepID=UPI000E703FA5|nr:uncharacterized protein LOC113335915 [Papaver somniferum]